MNISIGSDHRGVDCKSRVTSILEADGNTIQDCGAYSADSCDYPDIAHAVAETIANGTSQRGILICGSGIGMSIAANKTMEVRAALCHDSQAAEMSRRHNNANVLCLSADVLDELSDAELQAMIQCWMNTEFEGGRHQRRVDKITSGVNSSCHE